MKWIEDKANFNVAYRRAFECAATDSGRLPTSLRRLTFDDIELRSDEFAGLLQHLLVWLETMPVPSSFFDPIRCTISITSFSAIQWSRWSGACRLMSSSRC